MEIIPVKTELLLPPDHDLLGLIKRAKPPLKNGDILVIASKVVAIAEGRLESRADNQKDDLIRREAEYYLERDEVPGQAIMHVRLHGQLAGSAGIDPFGEWYVLWPEDPMASAERLCLEIKNAFSLDQLGIIISDSKSTPLRRGVIGGAIGWAGFNPLFDNRKRIDLTGRASGGSQINVADAVAAAAVLVMGEGVEQTPLVIVRNSPYAFDNFEVKKPTDQGFVVPFEEDIFAPFYNNGLWQKGGRGG